MFADAIRCTHNGTGGSSTLTLTSVTGYPQPTSVFGTSGTRIVYYEIAEYTDSTFATLNQYERGIGSLVLSTNVLTRSRPDAAWTSSTYTSTGATALTITNTAANVQILLTASTVTQRPALPAMQSAVLGSGWAMMNTRQQADSNSATYGVSSGNNYYIPIEFSYGKPITAVAIEVTTAAAGSARLALYDWGTDGLPQNLITEFTASTQFNTGSTGVMSVTGNWFIPPGWYWLLLQFNAAPSIRTYNVGGNSGGGENGQRDLMFYIKSGTYGTLPNPGDKTAASSMTRSGNVQPIVWCK